MNLDQVQAELRPRLPWEAADFGLALGRKYASAIMLEWIKTAWVTWLLAGTLLFIAPLWASVLLWWLKPMMSVRPVFFLSRRLFGIVPTNAAARQAFFSWLMRRAWADLTVARFRRRRGILQIVRILEGAKAPAQRLTLFYKTTPSWLIKGCLMLEFGLYMGLIVLVFWFGPESWVPWTEESGGVQGFFDSLKNNDLDPAAEFRFGVIALVSYGIASTVSELAYMTSCFGCYLNTRTELEGWDLEIAFKRIAARSAKLFAPMVIGMFLIACTLMPRAHADESDAPKETPEQVADRITSSSEFIIHKETTKKFRPNAESVSSLNLYWLSWLVYPLAILVIAAAVGILVWFLFRYARIHSQSISIPRMPEAVAGLDIRPESLPADPLATAREWWAQGRHREALSLLYRAALSWLIHQSGVEIEPGDTEGQCTRRVAASPHAAGFSAYFHQLTRAWLGLAYAQSSPSAATWDALCEAWPFRAATKPARNPSSNLAILLLLCVLISGCGRFEESEETKGYRGKARYDPYLAVSRLNEETGYGARTSFSLMKELTDQEYYGNNQWVLTPSMLVNERTAKMLLEHVNGGDHLILALSDIDLYEEMGMAPSRWVKDDKPVTENEEERRERWVKKQLTQDDEQGLLPTSDQNKNTAPKSIGQILTNNLRTNAPGAAMIMEYARVRFADEVDEAKDTEVDGDLFSSPDWGWPAGFLSFNQTDDALAMRVMTVEYGNGWITFIPSMRPFTNLRIADANHASLWQSIGGWHGGEVCFIRGTGASFLAVLWEYGWRTLIAILLALILWLWAITKRYGRLPPLRIPTPLDSKAGLIATGNFLVRKKQVPALLAPWAESIYARWRRNQPAEPEPSKARFMSEIAPEAGLSEAEISECFSPSERTSTRNFIALAKRLWRIERAF